MIDLSITLGHALTIRECDLVPYLVPFNSAFFKFQIFVTVCREIYDLRMYWRNNSYKRFFSAVIFTGFF